jgi:hypothetical protein
MTYLALSNVTENLLELVSLFFFDVNTKLHNCFDSFIDYAFE